ncbi:sensor histidine kinase [Methanococcoides burtonii]|uniref:PleD-like multisensor signal transduction histidine kinase n=1 Tax=Methanococcoides burtonii (strain DSM 6242 / NBRC 107633 / OCM 468 / ACE-M) TaxID=259564 RepID=Q12UU5_METBU|nr:response regulator [Methanococcoides burtonii]ABE52781.1 pleD-like multisensor signal transduction histidine kinase [Methanococcoides burtonii DSM 6242]
MQNNELPRILVVDDDQKNVELMEAYLSPDYETIPAYRGKEALEILEKDEIDLVLLDVMMPDMKGYEVCIKLKEDIKTQFIPVIIVSALSRKKDRIQGLEAGADEFLTKPVDQIELKTRVKSLLRLKELYDRNIHEKELANKYFDTADVMLIVIDPDHKIKLINKKGCKIMACEEMTLIGTDFFNTMVPERFRESGIEDFYRFISGNISGLENFEAPLLRLDGEERIVNWHNTLLKNKNGKITGMLSSGEDITERKRVEEALIETEEIHEKEIHHRIKNNLQIIASLLDLEASNFTDPQVINAFKESRDRIHSISIAHEELYRSRDMTNVAFQDYAKDVTNYLYQMNGQQAKNIKLRMEVEDTLLSVDRAIHLGLILNELIVNCFKYAFPDGKGNISIVFHRKDDQFTLIVADNGIGIQKEIEIGNTKTLGMQLVNELVKQIGGNIHIDRSNGTKVTITFKDK